ncbi:MAG: DMT family transporter [Oscillospiraceae bacterium]|nr:DMT family transporter [Oscillospiraceae bacterium]
MSVDRGASASASFRLALHAVIGTVNTGLAYLLYFSGLQKLSGQSVALISYVDPVSALLFSALFLRESLTPVQMIGAVLIIGGAMLGELKKRGPEG